MWKFIIEVIILRQNTRVFFTSEKPVICMDIAIVVEMSTTGMISLYPSRKYQQHNVIFSSRSGTRIGRAWAQDNINKTSTNKKCNIRRNWEKEGKLIPPLPATILDRSEIIPSIWNRKWPCSCKYNSSIYGLKQFQSLVKSWCQRLCVQKWPHRGPH